jgi:hypothetical protein
MADDLAILREVEKRFDDLREADRKAVEVATGVLAERMAGFPEEFARRGDVAQALEMLQKMDKEKLPESVFTAFVDTYRIEQARADDARRTLADTLATATDAVKVQIFEERGTYVTEEHYAQRHEAVLRQVDAVERWQYKLVGGLVFATFVAPIVSAVLVYYFTTSP